MVKFKSETADTILEVYNEVLQELRAAAGSIAEKTWLTPVCLELNEMGGEYYIDTKYMLDNPTDVEQRYFEEKYGRVIKARMKQMIEQSSITKVHFEPLNI